MGIYHGFSWKQRKLNKLISYIPIQKSKSQVRQNYKAILKNYSPHFKPIAEVRALLYDKRLNLHFHNKISLMRFRCLSNAKQKYPDCLTIPENRRFY